MTHTIFKTPEGFKLSINVEEDKISGGRSTINKFIKECFDEWKTQWKVGIHNRSTNPRTTILPNHLSKHH